MMNKDFHFTVKGIVVEKLPNNNFYVKCDNGEKIMADARIRRIVEGSRVLVSITVKEPKKGKITSVLR